MDRTTLKQTACDAIDSAAEELNILSQEIWKNPELADKEFFAHDLLTEYLERKGFDEVEKKWLLDTAFRATFGDMSTHCPHIVVISEYDALPEIGHACGHNLIAEVGIAAGLGIKAVLERCGKSLGRLTVMGTPAEERYGGKTRMINAGAFKDVDVAMMAHPSKYELLKPNYTAIKGIISNGGQRPNIIPGHTQLEFYIRCPTVAELNILEKKIVKCGEAAASATGCEVEFIDGENYESLMSNNPMVSLYEKNGISLGIQFEKDEKIIRKQGGSSDMGNVSHAVPSIHPEFRIGSPDAQPYTLSVAKALAMTAIDILTDPDILTRIQKDFQEGLKQEQQMSASLL